MYGKDFIYLQVQIRTFIKNIISLHFVLRSDNTDRHIRNKNNYDDYYSGSYDKDNNCNIFTGALLAGTLDYFGKHEEAERLYIEILEINPTGDYICDYAIFLHRRKRNYDQAEM